MAEELHIAKGGKEQKYELLYRQVVAMLDNERDVVANMANLAAMIHQTFGFWWTGFYRVVGQELVLGPFQGPIACTRIAYGRGVCGTAWQRGESVVVEDVEKFPGHIACSSLSRSEIVVPIYDNDRVVAVLDIDSEHLATFDEVDKMWLERIVKHLYLLADMPSEARV
jgi:GAF domain-containing protein